MSEILCPTGCDNFQVPVVDYDDCNPEVSFGEIEKIYIASMEADDLTNVWDVSEWASRIDNEVTGDDDAIRELTVSADLPAGEFDIVEISNRRKVTSPNTFTLAVTIDDNSDLNYEFMRWTECNPKVKMWYATQDHLYGGNEGIRVDIMLKEVIERGNKALKTLQGTISWEDKFSPQRIPNPLT